MMQEKNSCRFGIPESRSADKEEEEEPCPFLCAKMEKRSNLPHSEA
jgi:hypothetical protein